jgi:hypothetical protein
MTRRKKIVIGLAVAFVGWAGFMFVKNYVLPRVMMKVMTAMMAKGGGPMGPPGMGGGPMPTPVSVVPFRM